MQDFIIMKARVAQLVVQLTRNEQVVGSTPISGYVKALYL